MPDLKSSILQIVRDWRFVTFAEVARLPGAAGEAALMLRPNVVLWSGLSQDAADAVMQLRNEDALHFKLSSRSTYLIDGAVLDLPIAKQAKRMGYASPHWLPVTLNPGAE